MGSCYNCGVVLTLKEDETTCDRCGAVIRYTCWQCKHMFEVIKENKQKLKECLACGYFYCPSCDVCSQECPKTEWYKDIAELFRKYEITENPKLIDEICEYIEDVKIGNKHLQCPYRVPISYAKNRNKWLLVRMEGYKVRDKEDFKAFNVRMEEILDRPIGDTFLISKTREAGTYGQEYRDVLNLGVCMGKIQIIIKERETGEDYMVYERIEGSHCKHLTTKNLAYMQCPKCKEQKPKEQTTCDTCSYKRDTRYHKKGEPYKLKEKLSNIDPCQLSRMHFEGVKSGESKLSRDMGKD